MVRAIHTSRGLCYCMYDRKQIHLSLQVRENEHMHDEKIELVQVR